MGGRGRRRARAHGLGRPKAGALCLVGAAVVTAATVGGPASAASGHRVGLGKVVSSKDGGQIFGWDVARSGTVGVLASSQDTGQPGVYKVSVETFDQATGDITRSFARDVGSRNSYLVDGIAAGGTGLITHFVVPDGGTYAHRRYDLMDPVSSKRFTGTWTAPVRAFDVRQLADNQRTATSAILGIELHHQDRPDLLAADLPTGQSTVFRLDPALFGAANGPVLAQDTTTNQAVIATSPDGGAVGGQPPLNAVIDLDTGAMTTWPGINDGPFHAGSVNGLAVDSGTGIACTTTELNAQVEFYNLATRTGTEVQLPGTSDTSQLNSGAAVANDSRHHLFLVADPVYAPTGDSAIVVYDEQGRLVEAISGFNFSNRFTVVPVRVAVVPRLRMGWVDGPGLNQLQQFFY